MSKQIIHSCGGFLGEGFEEWRPWVYAILKNLEDNIHAVGFHLQYNLSKAFHELSQGLIFLYFDVLQCADILLVSS